MFFHSILSLCIELLKSTETSVALEHWWKNSSIISFLAELYEYLPEDKTT